MPVLEGMCETCEESVCDMYWFDEALWYKPTQGIRKVDNNLSDMSIILICCEAHSYFLK